MEKDTAYENNNIGFDVRYPELNVKIMNYVKNFYRNGGLNVRVIIYVLIVICYLELGNFKGKNIKQEKEY